MLKLNKRLQDVLDRALKGFDLAYSAYQDIRENSLEDRRFASIEGAQWDDNLSTQFENRPMIEINKVAMALLKIKNDYRKNRITIDFKDKKGNPDLTLPDTLDMLLRADMEDSNADEAFDLCFDEGIAGGFGAIRLRADYEDEYDEENTQQRIYFDSVYEADRNVWWDIDAKSYDKRDAKQAWLLKSQSRESFDDEHGMDADTWNKIIQTYSFDWCTPDVVYTAEYFDITLDNIEIYTYTNALQQKEVIEYRNGDDMDALQDEQFELESQGYYLQTKRTIKRPTVRKYVISGAGILEECGRIPGKFIPLAPFYGVRTFIEDKEQVHGHVRWAKDPARIKNIQTSVLAELSASSTREKPYLTPEQVSGFEYYYKTDNVKNWSYMPVNPLYNPDGSYAHIGPAQYTKPTQVPPALVALLQATEQDLTEILGNHQLAEEIYANTSGAAIEKVQKRVDASSYIYTYNMAQTMKRAGEIWLSMAEELYVEDNRTMKGIDNSGEVMPITINASEMDGSGTRTVNEIRKAKMDVTTSIGPASDTAQEALVDRLMGLVGLSANDPETQKILVSTILMNLQGDNLTDMRKYFRLQLVRMGVKDPTDEEKKVLEAESQQANEPSPQEQLMLATAQKESAEAAQKQADVVYKQAKAGEAQAKTAQILHETDVRETKDALNLLQSGTLNDKD